MTLRRTIVPPPLPTLDVAKTLGQPASTMVRGGPFLYVSGLMAVDPPARTAWSMQLRFGNGCEIECLALAG